MKNVASSVFLALVVAILSTLTFAQQTGDFSIIVMPDVQNESQFFPGVLQAQTQWIVNQRQALNIQMVLGLGDIVNNGSDNTQWTSADAAYHLLDQAQMPYLLAIGNHDYDNFDPASRTAVGFNQWFGPGRYNGAPWYGANLNDSNENFYGTLTISGKTYLFLVLEFIPRDDTVTWAQSVLAANPDKEAIIVTHSYLYSDSTRVDQCDTQDLVTNNYGDKLWAKLVSQYPNVSLVLSGHITSGNGSRRPDIGVNSNLVNQIFANYQTLPNGGNGWLRILTFHPASDTIDVQTYSPYLNTSFTDATNQFTVPWHAPVVTATTGTISGRVRDPGTCKAIVGAQVTAGGTTSTTDANGHFSITLAGGSYTLASSANDYNPTSLNVNAYNGYDSEANVFLTAAIPAGCVLSTTSPSVTICTPANNATVASPVSISAGTTDSNPVTYVQLYVDGQKSVTQNGGVLNTTATLADGPHKLTIQAKDSTGTLVKQVASITVSENPNGPPPPCPLNTASPSVTICSPLDGSVVTSPFTVLAGSTDSNSVSNMQFFVDGVGKVTQSGGILNYTATVTDGPHRLTVQAKDSMGTIFKQTINVIQGSTTTPPPCTLNTASPSVTICTPMDGDSVSSPVTVTAGTTDSTSTVSYVQLFVDGASKVTQNGGVLNTSMPLSKGVHRVTVQAKDAAGTVFKSTININVQQ